MTSTDQSAETKGSHKADGKPRAQGLMPVFKDAQAATRWVTLMSVLAALILIGVKLVAWTLSGSISLLASLADSGLDLIASVTTFFVVRYAAVPPDAEHRFGHGKAEAFAALFQAGLVFASAALIGQEAIHRLGDPEPVQQGGLAIGVLVFSILLTLVLVSAQHRVMQISGSLAVKGDRMHYMADLLANLVAIAGLVISLLSGWHQADAIGGFLVAAWLVWGAIGVLREAADHLMDKGLPPEEIQAIVRLVLEDPQISNVHQLRTRMAGPYILMQMHADLEPALSLEAAHAIVVQAEKRILEHYPNADILIHPDPRGRAEPHGGPFHELGEA
ncbi:MAG: cation diffusion facilitator family transporter [Asticcacaulis sp.]